MVGFVPGDTGTLFNYTPTESLVIDKDFYTFPILLIPLWVVPRFFMFGWRNCLSPRLRSFSEPFSHYFFTEVCSIQDKGNETQTPSPWRAKNLPSNPDPEQSGNKTGCAIANPSSLFGSFCRHSCLVLCVTPRDIRSWNLITKKNGNQTPGFRRFLATIKSQNIHCNEKSSHICHLVWTSVSG